MKYYLIAGEASGDLHASHLMHSIKKIDPQAEFRFFGGDLMQAEGGTLVRHYREMAFMGFIAVVKNLNKVLKNIRLCKSDIASFQPDVVILVDYPGFNLKIAEYVKKTLHIPVHYYISPKIWAWKEYRIKSIRKYIDQMYSILPFEIEFYNRHHYPVEYVGNPTLDEIASRPYQDETFQNFTHDNKLPQKPIIALLSGSRKAEIQANLPTMIQATAAFPDYQPVIAGAPGIDPTFYQTFVSENQANIVYGKTFRLLQQSSAALVTSGTATLETALLNVPQIVCYKMAGGKFIFWLFKHILHVRFISLVNLIADQGIVRELLVHLFTVNNLKKELSPLLQSDSKERQDMLNGYTKLREILGKTGAPERAAQRIVSSIKKSTP